MNVRIISGDRGRALIAPTTRLGDNFAAYLAATRQGGAWFDRDRKCQTCRLGDLIDVVAALHRAGFCLDVAKDLQTHLTVEATRVQTETNAASDRVAQTDAALAARGLSLYPFQRDGVRWLAPRAKALLADQMGLGKTVQALIALPEDAGVVVVAPAAVKGVWAAEARRWRPEYAEHITILQGRGSFRWPAAGEIVITNYDILPSEFPAPPAGVVLIADEAHALKSSKAQRTKKFRALADAVLANGRVWLLTGTPLLNRPPELYAVLRAAKLDFDAFGPWTRFVRLFNGRKGYWGGYDWGSPSAAVPDLLRRVSLCRRRDEVLPDLPTKTWREIEVSIDAATERVCDEALERLRALGIDLEAATSEALLHSDEAIAEAKAGAAEAYYAFGEEVNTRGIGRVLFSELSRARAALATAKVPAMLEQVEAFEDAEEPVVVFSAHRAPVDVLAAREGWAAITGDTPAAERTAIVERFQAGEIRGLAATIQAAGVGLTLTRAHQCLFVDLGWTPALNAQAEDRLCRIGQTRGVVITRLIARHAVDSRVTELLAEKQALIERTVDASATTSVPDTAADVAAALASPAPQDPSTSPQKRSGADNGREC